MMPEENTFILSWSGGSVYTTPTNWDSMEMGISRELFAIKRDVTTELSFIGDASDLIIAARLSNKPVMLSLYRRSDVDWSMSLVRTWKADMATYYRDGDTVSVGFYSSTAREEIEKNKSTKYEIPLPSTNLLKYSGIDRDSTNVISGIIKKIDDSNSLHFGPSNWILPGNHSKKETASIIVDNFKISAVVSKTLRVRIKLGEIIVSYMSPSDTWDFDAKIMLCKYHENTLLSIIGTWSCSPLHMDISIFYNHTETNSEWILWGSNDFIDINMNAGDDLRLMYNTSLRPSYIKTTKATDLRFEIVTLEQSSFIDYGIQTITASSLINALLSKMCTTPPALLYLLNTVNYIPVFTSSQGMTQENNPTITTSFEDVMKFLLCTYGADYEITDDGNESDKYITIAHASLFLGNTQASIVTSANNIKTKHDASKVYGTVISGFESDSDAENGTYDPLCKNTFKIGDSDNELNLVSPYKGTPTTIEQFLRDKSASSTKTKDSDSSVFVFAVNNFINGETTLYRNFTINLSPNSRVINSNYFNLPFSPMRMLIANGRLLKVSKWNDSSLITFVSTDRSNQLSTTESGGNIVYEFDGNSPDLISAMSTPLFLPETIEFETFMNPWSSAEINIYPRKYFTVLDIYSNKTYNFYINDVSLPLSAKMTTSFNGIIKG